MTEFFFLGKLIQVQTAKGKFDFPKGFILLADSESGNYLVGIHRDEISPYMGEMSRESKKKFFEFNGFEHKEFMQTDAIDFSEFDDAPFARALSITYDSRKLHGGGDGRPAHYVHKFGKNVSLWMNATNSVYLIGGGNLVVTERGIVN